MAKKKTIGTPEPAQHIQQAAFSAFVEVPADAENGAQEMPNGMTFVDVREQEKKASKATLEEIEEQLRLIASDDRADWVKMYELIEDVIINKKYLPDYKTINAWVNHIAVSIGVNVSLIWRRKGAGEFYEKMAAADDTLPELSAIQTSSATIKDIEKLTAGKVEDAAEWMHHIIDKTARPVDVHNAYERAKEQRRSAGLATARTSRYKSLDELNGENGVTEGVQSASKSSPKNALGFTADDVYTTIAGNRDWITTFYEAQEMPKGLPLLAGKYRALPEFPVYTHNDETTRARRIDALVLETYTARLQTDVVLHGIEIKADAYDLENDHKMAEYTDFVDFFWLAVPDDAELVQAAKDYVLQEWGILVIGIDEDGKKTVRIEQAPQQLETDNENKLAALLAAVQKLL